MDLKRLIYKTLIINGDLWEFFKSPYPGEGYKIAKADESITYEQMTNEEIEFLLDTEFVRIEYGQTYHLYFGEIDDKIYVVQDGECREDIDIFTLGYPFNANYTIPKYSVLPPK